MAPTSSAAYNGAAQESNGFPWLESEVLCHQDLLCEGKLVTPEIHAKMEKGFFIAPSDGSWTCYRRNYFSIACSFELRPHIPNGRLSLRGRQIQALGMSLSAAQDGLNGKTVELVQYTPKRDQGDRTSISVVKVAPSPPKPRHLEQQLGAQTAYQLPMASYHSNGHYAMPCLPMQAVVESPARLPNRIASPPSISPEYAYSPMNASQLPTPGQNVQCTFERVQFKSATANNGKRRASQQYYHLIVELWADVRTAGAPQPKWEKIAIRVSDKLVVRGRSPRHYKESEGVVDQGGSSSISGPSTTGYTTVIGTYPAMARQPYDGPAGHRVNVLGSFRSSQQYDYKNSPTNSLGSSSASSAYVGGFNPHDNKYSIAMKNEMGDALHPQDPYGYSYPAVTMQDPTAYGAPVKHEVHLPRFDFRDEYAMAQTGNMWGTPMVPVRSQTEHSREHFPTDLYYAS